MATLSIDVGLCNLSFCIMEAGDPADFLTFKILLWDVFNLVNVIVPTCQGIQKNGRVCGKGCSSVGGLGLPSCKKHAGEAPVPFRKAKVGDLSQHEMVKLIVQKVQGVWDANVELFGRLRKVVIELQPQINQKMKFVSHVVFGKLADLLLNHPGAPQTTVGFVGAAKKLKVVWAPDIECTLKNPYARRKWLSVQYTRWILENKFDASERDHWLAVLNGHATKIDDMADTFLMAVNEDCSRPKKRKIKNV